MMATEEELNALVKRAMDRAIERLQKLHDYAGRPAWDQVLREELSGPITTLRAQLAEARANEAALAEIRKTLAAPDDWHPVDAVKALKRSHDRAEAALAAQQLPSGWADVMSSAIQRFEVAAAINGSAVWKSVGSKAMAELLKGLSSHVDRAEAVLAAQIEADAGMIERIVTEARREVGNIKLSKVDAAVVEMLSGIVKAIRNQPYDRTALERHDAKTREKALREAAEKAKASFYGVITQDAILALIEKVEQE